MAWFYLIIYIARKFNQRRSRNSSSRCVFRREQWWHWRIKIPIWYHIFRQTTKISISRLASYFKKTYITSFTVNHRITIDGPGLTTSPHCTISQSLMSDTFNKMAIQCIVNRNMVARMVCTEMIFHSCFCMFYGYIIQPFVATVLSRPKKQFKIHHIINNGVMRPIHLFDHTRPR